MSNNQVIRLGKTAGQLKHLLFASTYILCQFCTPFACQFHRNPPKNITHHQSITVLSEFPQHIQQQPSRQQRNKKVSEGNNQAFSGNFKTTQTAHLSNWFGDVFSFFPTPWFALSFALHFTPTLYYLTLHYITLHTRS